MVLELFEPNHPATWMYGVKIHNLSTVDSNHISNWCLNNIAGEWSATASIFYFKREKDRMLFILKWS